jgi:hypothetical protein
VLNIVVAVFRIPNRFLFLALLVAPLWPGSSGRELIEGWVSDSACGAQHTKPGGERCVKLCIQGGGSAHPEWKPQKMVLVSDIDGKIWTVANPSNLAGFEGKHVRVSASRHQAELFVYSPVIVKENNHEQ